MVFAHIPASESVGVVWLKVSSCARCWRVLLTGLVIESARSAGPDFAHGTIAELDKCCVGFGGGVLAMEKQKQVTLAVVAFGVVPPPER